MSGFKRNFRALCSVGRTIKRLYSAGVRLLHPGDKPSTIKNDGGDISAEHSTHYSIATLLSAETLKQLSENLRGLLSCRFDELSECAPHSLEQAMQIVDLFDELRIMKPTLSDVEIDAVKRVEEHLKQRLEKSEGELLCCEKWDPQLQRAVSVDRCLPENSHIIIKEHKSYGLKMKGKLVRKEEVTIQAPAINH